MTSQAKILKEKIERSSLVKVAGVFTVLSTKISRQVSSIN